MPDSILPDAVLADALGVIIAEFRAEWSRDLRHFRAECEALIANARLQARDIKGERGDKGEPGVDGLNIARVDIDAQGQLVVTFSDGQSKPIGRVVGSSGIGIASIERRERRLFLELDDGRIFDAGDIAGEPGQPGEPGPQGPPGTAASGDLIKAVVELDVHKAVQAIPIPKDGKDGRDGRDGVDGKDGISFEEFEETFDGERTITRTYRRGDTVLAVKTYKLPSVIYRRVWKEGGEYDRGDLVTWRGSLWHCNEPTTEAPGDGVPAWTLAAKRGADGRNGKDGAPGARGPEGKAGRDMKY